MNTRYTCFSLKDLHPWEWEQSNSLSGVAIDLNGLCYCPLQSLKIPKLPITEKYYGIMILQHNRGCKNWVQRHNFCILVMLGNHNSAMHLGEEKMHNETMIPLCKGVKRCQYKESVILLYDLYQNHTFI